MYGTTCEAQTVAISTRLLKGVTIIGMISIIPVFMAVNASFGDWHREFIRSVADPEIDAKLKPVTEKLDATNVIASGNANALTDIRSTLETLNVQSAVIMVSTLDREMKIHAAQGDHSSPSWQLEQEQMKRRYNQAVEYRDCLMAQRRNCDLLVRSW